MSDSGNVVLLLFILLAVVVFAISLDSVLTDDYGTKFVPCYDRHDNKIIDQTCIEKTSLEEEGILIIMGMAFVSFLLVMMGWVIKETMELSEGWGY